MNARAPIAASLALLIVLLTAGTAFGQAGADLVDLEDEVVCIVCERPLSTSSGAAAEDQREVIQGLIDDGLTKQQVKDRLVAEYGEGVLVTGRSPGAAIVPIGAALIGVASIALLLRRRRGQRDGGSDGGAAHGEGPRPGTRRPAASPQDDARIDAELAERG